MSLSADTLKLLIDAGLAGDALVNVVRSIEADHGPSQSSGAERQRRYRQRQKEAEAGDVTGDVTPLRNECDVPPSLDKSPHTPKIKPTPPTHTGETRARKAEPFPKPDWADPAVWADLLTNRRKKNLPNTASAHRKLLADIERLTDANWPPGRILEAAVSRGWGAIYAGCKDEDDGRNTGNRGSSQRMGGPGPSTTLTILRAANGAIARNAEGGGGTRPALPASEHGG